VTEDALVTASAATVVLGEPGMGKTELMRQLAERTGARLVTAVRLMLSKDPSRLVTTGSPLLIDALDEAMARREGDAVDLILAQLEAAGSPPFILSCRAREWQSRSVSNLRQIYGTEPSIYTLEPLSRKEAAAFLATRLPTLAAEPILDHLDAQSLSDLYKNPLTLGLMGRVASHDAQLPATRAGLFERTCHLIWPEHDPDRQDEGLGQLSEDEALDTAGALAACLLFAGAEAINRSGAAVVQSGDIRLADIIGLPDAAAARAILSSKLFHSVGTDRAKPIHRVIAEYLAARWLARQASSPRIRRRLLSQLQGSGGVPASLRGLHAWLAYHSAAMAESIIAADPYGVLRYGETAALTPSQADCLFDALCALADDDPWFRGNDWDLGTAAGLMIPHLRSKIAKIISSADSNIYLRSLLIESLRDVPLATDLADELEAILMGGERFYRERRDAAEALLAHRDRAWWRAAVARLHEEASEDGARLARNVIELIEGDIDPALLVAVIFAETGATRSVLPRAKGQRIHTVHHYGRIIAAVPITQLAATIDLFAEYVSMLGRTHWQYENDVANIVTHLIVRAIDEEVVGIQEAAALWRWLGAVEHAQRFRRDIKQELRGRLSAWDDLRHAVQDHALSSSQRERTLWATEWELSKRLVSMTGNTGDIARQLKKLAPADHRDPALREDWKDLMRLARGPQGYEAGVLAIGEKFMRGDVQLTAFLRKLENPKKPAWERAQERRDAKQARKQRVAFETHRRRFSQDIVALRAGDLAAVIDPARAYLGHFTDISREQTSPDRIAEWLGPALRDEALRGFEAVLHRSDLPTPEQLAIGFADDVTYNYGYPIMAGLFERMRTDKGLSGLPADVQTIGLLLCYNDRGWSMDDQVPALQAALEATALPDAEHRAAFARLWIEPSLRARRQHVPGAYKLAHDADWQATGGALADGWLMSFPDLPENVELELVDCLTHSGELKALETVAQARSTLVHRNFDHMLAWLAIDVLVRFEAVLPDLIGIGERNPEFIWFLRNRLRFERRSTMLPLTVAQASWVIAEFRRQWPYATLQGSGSGDTNPYDATDFLRGLIDLLANDTSAEACEALQRLLGAPADSYSGTLRHMAAQQRQKLAEQAFSPLRPQELGDLLADGPPSNIDDLKALVLDELAVARRKLLGQDIDEVRDFWTDNRIPRDENRCRDRLTGMIEAELARVGIQRVTEADMPNSKRADLAFAYGQMQLPMEIKGQWHPDVWDAATGQLDLQYLIDWRSEQRGLYCVLWFGDLRSATGRRLKAHPDRLKAPATADEMHAMLVDRVPEPRRSMIDIVVLDLTAIKG
jgi:hypothetical protein